MPSDTYTLTIADAGVSTPADGSVTTVKIVNLNVTTDKLADSAVTSAKILNGTILADDLATDSVVTAKVANLNITTDKLAANAVTTAKITDANVTDVKLASNSVTTAKIANGSVNGDKLAANAVSYAKFRTIPATSILGNSTGGDAIVENKTCNAFGFDFLSSADLTAAKGKLGLGSMATQESTAVAITGGTIENVTLTGSTVSVSSPSGILPTANGGTGRSTYTAGDMIYASGGATLSTLPKGAANLVLHGSGGGSLPAWGLINLATDVSGVLPTASGGTGLATITGYVKGTGTSALSTSATIPVADISGVLPVAKGGTGVTTSTYGEYYLSGTATTTIASQDTYYKVSGTTLANASSNMSMDGNNKLLYNVSEPRKFFVTFCATLHAPNGDEIRVAIHKNGSLVISSVSEVTASAANVAIQISGQCIVELNNTNFLELYVYNSSGTGAVTFDFLNLSAHALV